MKKLIYYFCFWRSIVKRIINSTTPLTPQYLIERGWVKEFNEVLQKTFYVEPNIKDRDKIYVEFENHCYRIWHSDKLTFIALERSIEWFEFYQLLVWRDLRYELI